MLALVFSVLTRNWRLSLAGIALLAALGLYLTGRHQGANSERKAEAERVEAARARVAVRQAKATAISTDVGASLQQARVQIRYRTRTLIEKVSSYVPRTADAACVVPRGFVQFHDAAAAGLPAPAGGPDETPSGVPLSAVAETVAGNYGVAYDWRAEALKWREWYGREKAEWDKR